MASWTLLVNHPFRNILISVNPAIAQKRPVRALRVDLAEIAFCHQNGLFRDAGLRNDLSRRVGDEALPPELNAAPRISVRRRLMSDAVGDRDINAVGDGVRALDRLPRRMLALAVFGFLAGMPADRGRVEQNLRPGERRQPSRFGIPLIPTDANAGAGVMSVERFE